MDKQTLMMILKLSEARVLVRETGLYITVQSVIDVSEDNNYAIVKCMYCPEGVPKSVGWLAVLNMNNYTINIFQNHNIFAR